jgi:hypothetical protein
MARFAAGAFAATTPNSFSRVHGERHSAFRDLLNDRSIQTGRLARHPALVDVGLFEEVALAPRLALGVDIANPIQVHDRALAPGPPARNR